MHITDKQALIKRGAGMQALELAREQGDSIKDQIWRELAKARCAMNFDRKNLLTFT